MSTPLSTLSARLAAFVLAATLSACSAAQSTPQTNPVYVLEPVASGLSQPLSLATDGVNALRLYIVEKTGAVRVLENGELLEEAFLELSAQISTNSERGLLDVAFAPDYAESGLVYAHYNDPEGTTVLSSFRAEGDRVVPESETVLLRVPQPYANHNGGQLKFGPDGYLYLALGDGGSGGDPLNHGQNPESLLGAILRLSVTAETYSVPESNPFVGMEGRAPEIWAWGLRNPWRFSFDRGTGDLWIADVGQNAFEEINLQGADSAGGENYGWNVMEASACYNAANCDQDGLVLPVLEYSHASNAGRSVTGGFVYRGTALPGLVGHYIFGDFVSGNIWHAAQSEDGWSMELLLDSNLNIASFGENQAGELYVVDFGGGVYLLSAE